MTTTETRIATANARRYMTQLCKHWAHKFEVVYDENQGLIPFDADRRCRLEADAEGLSITLEVADPEMVERMQGVVIDHLKRFAFREDLGEAAWRAVG